MGEGMWVGRYLLLNLVYSLTHSNPRSVQYVHLWSRSQWPMSVQSQPLDLPWEQFWHAARYQNCVVGSQIGLRGDGLGLRLTLRMANDISPEAVPCAPSSGCIDAASGSASNDGGMSYDTGFSALLCSSETSNRCALG